MQDACRGLSNVCSKTLDRVFKNFKNFSYFKNKRKKKVNTVYTYYWLQIKFT